MAVVYATVLVWAGALNAGATAGTMAAGADAPPVAGAITLAAGEVAEEIAAPTAIQTPAESPLATLGIAAGMVVLGAGWYAVHTYRARPRHARSARLIVRHITTLL